MICAICCSFLWDILIAKFINKSMSLFSFIALTSESYKKLNEMWILFYVRVTERSKSDVKVSKSSVRSVRQIGVYLTAFMI